MAVYGTQIGVPGGCGSSNGCAANSCNGVSVADFCMKRFDTKPPFRVSVSDCDGPLDLTADQPYLVLEVNMWAKAKLKADLSTSSDYFALADNIGFNQVMTGDIIVMDRVRRPEEMKVIGFDETNKLIQVERGYNNSDISAWKKGDSMRIFRIMNGVGEIVSTLSDITQEDGTVLEDQLTDTAFVYNWRAEDVVLPGCYFLEFKLIKMLLEEDVNALADGVSIIPSFIPVNMDCSQGAGIEWVRRFPENSEGFVIHIGDTPTSDCI